MYKKLLLPLFTSLFIISGAAPASALSTATRKRYGVNHILFYDPCEDDNDISEVKDKALSAVTVHGATIFDKFYYGFRSLFGTDTATANAWANLFYAYASPIGYINNFVTHESFLYLDAEYITAADITLATSGYTNDPTFVATYTDNFINEYIARLIYGLGQKLKDHPDFSKEDLASAPKYVETADFTPNPGTLPGYTYLPATEETGSEDSLTTCQSNLLQEMAAGETEADAPTYTGDGSGDASSTGSGELPADYTPASATSGSPTTTSNGYTVVNTPIPLNTYVSNLQKKGIRQSARSWNHSEVKDGKYGWGDQCYQLAHAQSNGLLHGTYPSTAVAHNPNQGSSWTGKDNLPLSEFLAIIYNQITNGHPVVVKVTLHRNKDKDKYYPATSTKDTRHFVTVVGFRSSVTSASSLTINDLYYLDSWNAELFSASASNARVFRPNEHIRWQTGTGYYARWQTR